MVHARSAGGADRRCSARFTQRPETRRPISGVPLRVSVPLCNSGEHHLDIVHDPGASARRRRPRDLRASAPPCNSDEQSHRHRARPRRVSTTPTSSSRKPKNLPTSPPPRLPVVPTITASPSCTTRPRQQDADEQHPSQRERRRSTMVAIAASAIVKSPSDREGTPGAATEQPVSQCRTRPPRGAKSHSPLGRPGG